MDEAKLAKRLAAGDRRALDRAMEYYTPYVSAVVWRALGPGAPREDVEDVVADAFLALWEHAGGLEPGRGVKAYLAAIARNRAADYLRAPAPPLPLSEAEGSPNPGPEEEAERREFAQRLWGAVDALPEPDRSLVFRYYYEEQRLKDIAAALGLSAPAAKVRLYRARRALKLQLTKGGFGCERTDG